MRKLIGVLITLATLQAYANPDTPQETTAQVKLTWQNPEKFSDIRPSIGSRKSFQENMIRIFDKVWLDITKKLPEGYQLHINITDLDLAGDVNPLYRVNGNDVRVMKEVYFPRMTFDYVLYNPQQQIVASEKDVKIKDMGYLNSGITNRSTQEFSYEKEMFKKWFEKSILKAHLGM